MASSLPTLWQIKVSHYNEKARWALDYKRVPHRRIAPLPLFGTLPAAVLMTRRPTFPVLRLDGRTIGDSTAIVAALEERYPDPPLYPSDPAERARALELEDFFDEQLAPYVRRLAWFHLSPHPRAFFTAVFPDSSPLLRAAFRPGAFAITRIAKARYRTNAATAAEARRKIVEAMERIEAEVGPTGYLVGDAFSVADLTAAALATPIIGPPQRQYLPPQDQPEPLRSFSVELKARPAGRWVLDMFARHRGVSAEVKRGTASPASPPAAVSA
ncbi:MAG TPA: glutathione S-transferase family protein [Conexibacter sp.]|nr:glutathione S-transferase family protein [Conexibacter sp.]